ncbi:hypothetical protein PDN50_29765 [Bacillus cereus]|nr:hypothetical protein [Bacillus cereus]MDA2446664.1 hypothetical protein [Bacillus cereus]
MQNPAGQNPAGQNPPEDHSLGLPSLFLIQAQRESKMNASDLGMEKRQLFHAKVGRFCPA